MRDLNRIYRAEPALHEIDFDARGFDWIDCNDTDSRAPISLIRRGEQPGEWIVAVFNWTPVVRPNYRVGVPSAGFYREILNSDASNYGGSNIGNFGGMDAEETPCHNHPYSLNLSLPPLGALYLKL